MARILDNSFALVSTTLLIMLRIAIRTRPVEVRVLAEEFEKTHGALNFVPASAVTDQQNQSLRIVEHDGLIFNIHIIKPVFLDNVNLEELLRTSHPAKHGRAIPEFGR